MTVLKIFPGIFACAANTSDHHRSHKLTFINISPIKRRGNWQTQGGVTFKWERVWLGFWEGILAVREALARVPREADTALAVGKLTVVIPCFAASRPRWFSAMRFWKELRLAPSWALWKALEPSRAEDNPPCILPLPTVAGWKLNSISKRLPFAALFYISFCRWQKGTGKSNNWFVAAP